MVELQQTPRMKARRVPLALAGLVVSLLIATNAQAITYFNADFGFDNSVLQLPTEYEIPLDAGFPFIASGVLDTAIGLSSEDIINDTTTSIDRTITWTVINNAPTEITEFILFLTALSPTEFDYSGAVIDVEISRPFALGEALGDLTAQGAELFDPMVIAAYGPYYFAGYHLTLDDFTLVGGDLIATRQFRYTVNVPEDSSGPPDLGIAYTTMVNVPEPATGLLFASALLLAAGTGRRQRS